MAEYYDLLEHCKKGEAKAQRMLYDLFKAKLMGLCRRYTNCREEAQDVLQESFIKIFRNINALESPQKLEAWMKTTTVHTAISHYHRTKRKESILITLPDGELAESAGRAEPLPGFSDEYLVAVVNELPEGCRMIFNLFAIEGYSHAEIGTLLNVTESTSRSQYHYARTILKKKLMRLDVTSYYEKLA